MDEWLECEAKTKALSKGISGNYKVAKGLAFDLPPPIELHMDTSLTRILLILIFDTLRKRFKPKSKQQQTEQTHLT